MKYLIKEWDRQDPNLIQDYVSQFDLGEQIDYDADFILAYNNNNELIGIAGVNTKLKLPQFEHIIIKPEYQKTLIGVRLMMEIERFLKSKGFDKYVSYILNTKEYMQEYALKWQMIPFSHTDIGVWFCKTI